MALSQMGEKAYRDAPGLNKSLLVPFMRSPRHYLHELNAPKTPTASMNLGTALHAELLQPERASSIYAVMKKVDKRTTAGKEYAARFEAENVGKTVIDEEQEKVLLKMRENVMRHPAASKLIERASHKEQALFAQYRATTVDHAFEVKALADGIIESEGIMFDVKTTESAAPGEYAKKVRAFRYDIQQVHYTYAGIFNKLPIQNFEFIVVENAEPCEVAVYTLDAERMKGVWDEWRAAMEFFAVCHQKQDFDIGYPEVSAQLKF
jgi:exodeoxyribonuclease VIII